MYYDPDTMVNMYGLSDMLRKGKDVCLNTKQENCFVVTDKIGVVSRSLYDSRGLYVIYDSPNPAVCFSKLQWETIWRFHAKRNRKGKNTGNYIVT